MIAWFRRLFTPRLWLVPCHACDGIGRINHRCGMGACVDDECPSCNGAGRVEPKEEEPGSG